MTTQLTAGQLEELRSVDSPTVANAIEILKVRDDSEGYMGMDISCLTPEFGVMVGYAVTVTADSTTPGRPRNRQGHVRVYDALAASPKPAVCVVQDVGSKRTHSCFMGDVIASLSHRLGAIGIVTNGGVRDLDGVRHSAFTCSPRAW